MNACLIEKKPLILMREINGVVADVRHMPLGVQEMAYANCRRKIVDRRRGFVDFDL